MDALFPQRKILIVDDEIEIAEMLQRSLSLSGYDVETTSSPVEALEKVQNENFRIVISDVMMPEMNGTELLREIKKFNGLIQVIMMTGYVTMENILAAFRRGASNVFFKPLNDLSEMEKEIETCFARVDRIKTILRDVKNLK